MAAVILAVATVYLSTQYNIQTTISLPGPVGFADDDTIVSIYGTTSIAMCHCDTWLIFYDQDNQNANSCCHYLPNGKGSPRSSVVALDTADFVFHISGGVGHSVSYGTIDDNYSLPTIAIGDLLTLDDRYHYEHLSWMSSPVAIDGYVLLGLLHTKPSNHRNAFSENFICTGIEASIIAQHHGLNPMVIISSMNKDPSTLLYWLSVCKLRQDVLSVHQFDATAPTEPGESKCAVQSVHGLHRMDDNSSARILCLEDVFVSILDSTAHTGQPSPQSFPVFSQVAMDHFIASSKEQSAARFARDMFSVLMAYQNLRGPKPPLWIHSIVRGLAELQAQSGEVEFCLPCCSCDTCVSIEQVRYAIDEETWNQAYGSLVWNSMEWFGYSNSYGLRDIVRHLWNRHQLYDNMFAIMTGLCENAATAMDSHRHAPFIQTSSLAQSMLIEFLTAYSSTAIAGSQIAQSLLKAVEAVSDEVKACSRWLSGNSTSGVSATCIHHTALTTPPLCTVDRSSVHVLTFLPMEDIDTGQEWIQRWKINCELCAMTVNYVLIPHDTSLFLHSNKAAGLELDGQLLRYVLLHIEEYMRRAVVSSDIVVILIGLAAMLSFKVPGGDGLIPQVKLDVRNPPYQLYTPLLFAVQAFPARRNSDCGDADFRAFVGTAPAMLQLLSHVMDDPLAILSGLAVIRSMQRFLKFNGRTCAIDTDRNIFDFDQFKAIRPIELAKHYHMSDRLLAVDEADIIADVFGQQSKTWEEICKDVVLGGFVNGTYIRSLIVGFQIVRFTPSVSNIQFIIYLIGEIPRNFKFLTAKTSLVEKIRMVSILESQLRIMSDVEANYITACQNRWDCINQVIDHWEDAILRALEEVYRDIGNWTAMIAGIHRRIEYPYYNEVEHQRRTWLRQRDRATRDESNNRIVHFFTYATENKESLRQMLVTAAIHRVNVTVLGIGDVWTSYRQKFEAYRDAISVPSISDDSVVVLVDAYDVLFFPNIKSIGKRLATSATPIISCAENGYHSDDAVPWAYKRGAQSGRLSDEMLSARFLNSGCLLGRTSQMRIFIVEALNTMKSHQDDQIAAIMYNINKPHMLSIDTSRDIFMCTYKEDFMAFAINFTDCSLIFRGVHTPVGLLHLNSGMYGQIAKRLFASIEDCAARRKA